MPTNRSDSAPVLQRFSPYLAAPKYTITGKWKLLKGNNDLPASNKYDIRELVTNTSKFRTISRPCGFSKAPRFIANKEDSVTKGPGQYDVAKSTIKRSDISFGKSTRPEINGKIILGPGPGQYETRDKNIHGEKTLSEVTCKFAGRTGWFYDNPEAGRKPGPGQYSLTYSQTEIPVGTETKIGTSLRPTIESHLGVNSRAPTVGPGHYNHLTTLGGAKVTPYSTAASYSFTSAATLKKDRPRDDPEMILQATQFPRGGFNP